jgi:hypothetical protein
VAKLRVEILLEETVDAAISFIELVDFTSQHKPLVLQLSRTDIGNIVYGSGNNLVLKLESIQNMAVRLEVIVSTTVKLYDVSINLWAHEHTALERRDDADINSNTTLSDSSGGFVGSTTFWIIIGCGGGGIVLVAIIVVGVVCRIKAHKQHKATNNNTVVHLEVGEVERGSLYFVPPKARLNVSTIERMNWEDFIYGKDHQKLQYANSSKGDALLQLEQVHSCCL